MLRLSLVSLSVARREFSERIRSKWFVTITLFGPLLMLAAALIPTAIIRNQANQQIRIELWGTAPRHVITEIAAGLRSYCPGWIFIESSSETSEADLLEKIARGEIAGYLNITPDILADQRAGYYGTNVINPESMANLEGGLNYAVVRLRSTQLGVSQVQADLLLRRVSLSYTYANGHHSGASGTAALLLAYIVMFVLHLSIVLYAVNVMRSVLQEKSTRIIELIVSAIRPFDLMLGKIVGVGCFGLVQLTIWGGMVVSIGSYQATRAQQLGAAAQGSLQLPELTVALAAIVLAYFLLGYFLYASLYAAVGAICSTEQDAQQAQIPILMMLVVPVFCMNVVANNPSGAVASVLTILPFSSPILMPMRYCLGTVGWLELTTSLLLLAGAVFATIFVAARIYRIGILMHGKRPTVGEVLRWVKEE